MNGNDAERALLGAFLFGWNEDVPVTAEDFYQPAHAAVYEAITRVRTAGSRPEPIRVRVALGTNPALRTVTPEVFLAELMEACPFPANASYYASVVAEEADLRRLVELSATIRQMAEDRTKPAEIADHAKKLLDATVRHGNSSRTWADIDPSVIDHIDKGARLGIPTPWPDLNRLIGGLVGSRLYTVAARPGEGKSLMAQGLATFACLTHHKPTLFASLEMSEIDLGVRVYADQADVPVSVLLGGYAAPHHWDAINKASNQLRSMGCRVNADPTQTVADIRAEARGIPGLGLVVVDYLQLVSPANRRQDRREQVDQIARDLKLLAKELDVPVVALAQLNRNNQQRADKTPGLADLRESGAIEQDSDVVILMQLDQETSELTVDVAKNRHGPKGRVPLQLWGHYSRIIQSDGKSA